MACREIQIFRLFAVRLMAALGYLLRAGGRLSLVLCLWATCGPAAEADEEVLWPQHPIHIDKSKQHFERLPAVQNQIESRAWVMVPFQIRIIDSARFAAGGTIYRIAHIRAVDRLRMCSDSLAGRWPCGRMAAIFLGNLVRNKRLFCDVSAAKGETVLDRCEFRSKNIGREIVLNGFAAAGSDSDFIDAEQTARARGSGLWRNPDCDGSFDRC